MNKTIIFVSFGKKSIHFQNLFSILSACYYIDKHDLKINILLFTDNSDFFSSWLNRFHFVDYFFLSTSVLKEWKGQYDYVFRIKIKSIMHALTSVGGKVLYLDGDTFFMQRPDKLFELIKENSTLMYLKEGIISDAEKTNWQCIRDHMKKNVFSFNNAKFVFPLETEMWNAGVIGIGFQNIALVNSVLDLTDEYCSQVSMNKYHQDQMMFSFVFQNNTKLNPADDYIFHYCYGNRKGHMDRMLPGFFRMHRNNHEGILEAVYNQTKIPVSNEPVALSTIESIFLFLKKRRIGLSMAINRVKKTRRIRAFFERGKKY